MHLEGTAPPDLIRRIAERNGLAVPEGTFAAPDRFAYRDFLDFLDTYDKAASVIRTGEDYRDITYEYLVKCAGEGAIYVELTASPDHAKLVGLTDEEHIDGIARGIDDARARHAASRAASSSPACATSAWSRRCGWRRYAAERPHPYIVGFSMAGDEENYPPGAYAEAFQIAADAGLGCTVHAGEWAGPESVRGGLELPVTRIAHGVRSIEDPALVEELAAPRHLPRVLPHEQRRARHLPELRGAPAAAPRGRRRAGHARLRRPALLRRVDRRRVRGLPRALRLRRRRRCRGITRTAIEAAFCEETLKERLTETV